MPQLIPFYFLNQLSFALAVLTVLVALFSTYVLPLYIAQQAVRSVLVRLHRT